MYNLFRKVHLLDKNRIGNENALSVSTYSIKLGHDISIAPVTALFLLKVTKGVQNGIRTVKLPIF